MKAWEAGRPTQVPREETLHTPGPDLTSPARTADPSPPQAWAWRELTRRPDSDAGRPLAGRDRVQRLGQAGAVGRPGAATRGESHPGPAAAASPSSDGPRSALGARPYGGSDPWWVTPGSEVPEPRWEDTWGRFRMAR